MTRSLASAVLLSFSAIAMLTLPTPAAAQLITEYNIPATSQPVTLAVGPDGALWYTAYGRDKIGRITTGGAVTEFALPAGSSRPYGIAAGPDGAMWFTELLGNRIGRITTGGDVTRFALPSGSAPSSIAAGPDGAMWFTEGGSNKIGRITTDGAVTEFPITAGSNPTAIVAGPDGALWFTAYGRKKIGRITTAGVVTNEYSTTGNPLSIVAGADGAVWFTSDGGDPNKIGRVTTAGGVTEYDAYNPYAITVAPDGTLWFTGRGDNTIGQISTSGEVTYTYTIPTNNAYPTSIAAGPDGALWFTEHSGDKIGRATVPIAEYAIPTADSEPAGIVAGPDGALWFTQQGANQIARITIDGDVTEFPVPTPNSGLTEITVGPDGALWFTEKSANKIGRITTAGTVTEYPVPTLNSKPSAIVAGFDGALWFTQENTNQIGRIDTGGGITEYSLPYADSRPGGIAATPGPFNFPEFRVTDRSRGTIWHVHTWLGVSFHPFGHAGGRAEPLDITRAPDGTFWFTGSEDGDAMIGREIDNSGTPRYFLPLNNADLRDIAPGPDGAMWFTEFGVNRVGRIIPGGGISEIDISTAGSQPFGITAGRDAAVWFTERAGNKIGRVGLPIYPLSVSAEPSGGGTVSGGGTFLLAASSQTVTATANAGYLFSNWTQQGNVVSTSPSYTFTLVGSFPLVANFVEGYTIAVSASPSAGGTVSGGGTFLAGAERTVTAATNSGYTFINWTEGGEVVSTSASYTFTLEANRTLVANFQPDRTIAVSASPAEGGSVSGGGTFVGGTSRTVSATANSGYTFINWTEGGDAVSTSASYTFTLDSDRTLVANFQPDRTIAVSASPSAGGSVSGGGTFVGGTARTVSATANSGYTFINWTEGGDVVSTSASYTFTLDSNRTLVANFQPPHTIAVSASPSAGGTVGGGGTFVHGSSRTVTAAANSGYAFIDWTEGGAVVSTSASYTFTLNTDRSLVANFKKETTTVVSGAPNPSSFGQPVTFTATVTAPASGTPAGNVTFRNGSETIGTATLSGGTATIETAALPVGTHTIRAVYAGNNAFVRSVSAGVTQTVKKAETAMTVTALPVKVAPGADVTLRAEVDVTGPASATPSGQVTFKEGNVPLGTGTITSGAAEVTINPVPIGTRTVTARYAGDANLAASTATTTFTVSAATGPQARVNKAANGLHQTPAVAALESGHVVVWSDGDVYAQRYSAAGAKVGQEIMVNSTTASDHGRPAVAGVPRDGSFIVVWQTKGDGSGYGIYGQRFRSNGAKIGDEFRINTSTAGNQTDPAVAALNEGGFVVTWTGRDTHGLGVFAQRYGSDGKPFGKEFLVPSSDVADESRPAIAAIPAGGFVIAWQAAEQDGSGLGIYARRWDFFGKAKAQFKVNTTTLGDQSRPSVVALGDGGQYVVAWQSALQDGSGSGIYAQIFGAGDRMAGDEIRVNTTTANDQTAPRVAAFSGGGTGFVIVWTSAEQDGSGDGVYAQVFRKSGHRVNVEFQVNSTSAMAQNQPATAAFALGEGQGDFIVVWTSETSDGEARNIFSQRFLMPGVQ